MGNQIWHYLRWIAVPVTISLRDAAGVWCCRIGDVSSAWAWFGQSACSCFIWDNTLLHAIVLGLPDQCMFGALFVCFLSVCVSSSSAWSSLDWRGCPVGQHPCATTGLSPSAIAKYGATSVGCAPCAYSGSAYSEHAAAPRPVSLIVFAVFVFLFGIETDRITGSAIAECRCRLLARIRFMFGKENLHCYWWTRKSNFHFYHRHPFYFLTITFSCLP